MDVSVSTQVYRGSLTRTYTMEVYLINCQQSKYLPTSAYTGLSGSFEASAVSLSVLSLILLIPETNTSATVCA